MSRRALRRLRGEQRGQEPLGPGALQFALHDDDDAEEEGPKRGTGSRRPRGAGKEGVCINNRFELVRSGAASGGGGGRGRCAGRVVASRGGSTQGLGCGGGGGQRRVGGAGDAVGGATLVLGGAIGTWAAWVGVAVTLGAGPQRSGRGLASIGERLASAQGRARACRDIADFVYFSQPRAWRFARR